MVESTTRTELYDGFGDVARALGAGRRLEILDFLSQRPRSVHDLADELGQSMANTSQHLQVLVKAGLVTRERDGQRVYYQLSSPRVNELLTTLRDVAASETDHVASLSRRHLGQREDVERVDRAEAMRMGNRGEALFIDVRPEEDYHAGRIRGAISVPLPSLSSFAKSVSPGTRVIAYCRGEYCGLADQAVRELRAHGIWARRLEAGFPEWVRFGGAHEIA